MSEKEKEIPKEKDQSKERDNSLNKNIPNNNIKINSKKEDIKNN